MKKMIFIILLFVTLTCSVCETFEVRSAQSSYQFSENEDVTLEWTFTDSSLDSLQIYCFKLTDDNPLVLLEYVNGHENPHDSRFSGRVQWDKDLLREGRISLYVSSLRTEDSGHYQCYVHTSEGSDSASCFVTVTDPFEVRSAQSSYQVSKNEDVTLEWTFTDSSLDSLQIYCFMLTDDNPLVLLEYVKGHENSHDSRFSGRVQWDKGILRERRIRLHVSSLRTEDSGHYQCYVHTSEGSDSASCFVTVTDPFEVRSAQSSYQVSKNEDVTLEWTFTDSSLDSLQISCFMLNDDNPLVLLEYVKGHENPHDSRFSGRVQWDKGLLRERRIRLHVSSLRTEDSGHYQCYVHTSEGSDWASCFVNVTEPQTAPETTADPQAAPVHQNPGNGGRTGLGSGPLATVICACVIIFIHT